MTQAGFQTEFSFFGNEIKTLNHDIHSKLAIRMEKNKKCKKSMKFGNIRKGIYVNTLK